MGMRSLETFRTGKVPIDGGYLRVKRTQGGLRISLKSPFLENFFKNEGLRRNDPLYQVAVYSYPDDGSPLGRLLISPSRDMVSVGLAGNRFNLNFLRAVGTQEGVEINVNAPISRDLLQDFLANVKTAVQMIYEQSGSFEYEFAFWNDNAEV